MRLLRQRAEASTELSEVFAALVYLGDTLSGQRNVQAQTDHGLTRENAGRIVSSFLKRVQAVA